MEEKIQFTLSPQIEGMRPSKYCKLSPELFKICKEELPNYTSRNSVKYEGDANSLETRAILEFFQKRNLTANWKRFPNVIGKPDYFQIKGVRLFSAEEINEAEFFSVVPNADIFKDATRDEDGELIVKPRHQLKRVPIGRTLISSSLICNEKNKISIGKSIIKRASISPNQWYEMLHFRKFY